MSKGLISFDLDGVLANFTRGFTRIGHELFGTPVGDGQSQETWFFEDYPQLGLDKVACDFKDGPIWGRIKTSPTFWEDLDPFNVSVMHRINRIKNKVFITNRLGVNPKEQSVMFLHKWGVYNANVIVAEKKAPVAVELNVVAHVDDYYKNIKELYVDATNVKFLALHYAPYNKIDHQSPFHHMVTLSVDHFIDECEARGYVEYE